MTSSFRGRPSLPLLLLPVATLALLVAASCGGSGSTGTGGTGTGDTGGNGGQGGHGGAGGNGGAGAGGGVQCGEMTCTGGTVCVVQVSDVITRFCAGDPCAPKPLSCDCVPILEADAGCGFDFYCVSATNGQISCMPYPDAGEAEGGG